MNKKDFKGFRDLKIENGLWAFTGENTWSRDINELWKWIGIAREIREHTHQVSLECAREAAKEISEKKGKEKKDG